MLTAVPPRLLHHARAGLLAVLELVELGLALLCPCEDDHGATAARLARLGQADDVAVDEVLEDATA